MAEEKELNENVAEEEKQEKKAESSAKSSTGIGLANLTDRWSMLVGAQVGILNDGKVFSVTLPLIRK